MIKRLVTTVCAIAAICSVAAQTRYDATWESLDKRETPQWWRDAKFGIFIHYGLYSVPAFSKVGEYSEWYWRDLITPSRASHEEVKAFHDKNYGETFTYPDFAPMFRNELFDADRWAKLFEDAGAKYVVLTSKHHDGYCLWDNKQADKSYGRNWNSTNTAPKCDILGELTEAVRTKTDLKMGIYFSIYEWYNPLYTTDPDLYVDKHLIPQFKDVVSKYSPAVIFSDGEWNGKDTMWRSMEMLQWLYNDSPCKDEVVINDRWGDDTRHVHGGYCTTEYGAGMPNGDKAWEENRGMAYSFGYSRTENLEDYHSSQAFVYMLVDIVSRGGNFLLDVGPSADGNIPVIMQERLTDIGAWLKVNGEAIYSSKCWDKSCQWTSGKRPEQKMGRFRIPYDVMKQTVRPDKGYATKEIFFTQNGDTLYAICPLYPDGELVIKDLELTAGSDITMLGVGKKLKWKKSGRDIKIEVPAMNPSKMPCDHAYTFKVTRIK